MKMIRFFLLTILIVGFIGIIPRSWSWADSHTKTPATIDSTNNMSNEEKCEEENYKRFERCMNPCHKDNREENYYKALKLYGKPTTFEGADIVFGYCMKVCQKNVTRIDCQNLERDAAANGLLIDMTNTGIRIRFTTKPDVQRIIRVERGSLVAQTDTQKPYMAPKNIKDVKAVLREITSIENAYAYLQQARKDFPTYKKSDYFSRDVEQQLERETNRERGELLDLQNYFATLSSHLDNARARLSAAVRAGKDNEEIEATIINKAQTDWFGVLSPTQRTIYDDPQYAHLRLDVALKQNLLQRNTQDQATVLIGAAQKQ